MPFLANISFSSEKYFVFSKFLTFVFFSLFLCPLINVSLLSLFGYAVLFALLLKLQVMREDIVVIQIIYVVWRMVVTLNLECVFLVAFDSVLTDVFNILEQEREEQDELV